MTKQSTQKSLTGFGFLLADTARLLRRRFEDKARGSNLTSAQWRAIVILLRTDGLSQVALAHRLEIEPMTVCRLVERMEAAGLVRRLPDPDDKRAKRVWLTERSLEMRETVRAFALSVYEEAFEGFDEDERAALISALDRVNANLCATAEKREDDAA